MKIIDADKLHYKQVYIQTEKGPRPALVVFAKEIRKMPEIVRCKDCRFFEDEDEYGNCYCSEWGNVTNANGYCHDAERRKND